MIDRAGKNPKKEAEEVKEILSTVSTEVPAMIRSILASVFSEEAGRNMGKAAAAYYKELRNGGLPDELAVKLTENYMRTFTSFGDMLRGSMRGSPFGSGADIGETISEAHNEKRHEEEEEEDE
jgi:hypothetical protein